MIDKELYNLLNAGHVKIKMEVNGFETKTEVTEANLAGMMLAITSLIKDIATKTNTSVKSVIMAINSLDEATIAPQADSEEQFEVMKEIVKQNLSPEDLK